MNNLLDSYKGKIVKESLIKSLIIGGIAGFSVMCIIAIISFITKSNLIAVTLILGLLTIVITTIVLFKTMYKTSIKVIARRVDELGLEERLITMLEFQDDDSVMASIQREDTQIVMQKVEPSSLKMKFVKWPIIACAVTLLLSLSLVTGSTVAAEVEDNKEPETVEPEELVDPYKDEIEYLVGLIRETIESAPASPKYKIYLNTIVDYMVEDLDNYDMLDFNSKKVRIEETHELIISLIDWDDTEEDPSPDGGQADDKDYVIDGNTEYEFVFPESYEEAMDLILNGNLPDEFKKIIQEYFGILDPKVEEE